MRSVSLVYCGATEYRDGVDGVGIRTCRAPKLTVTCAGSAPLSKMEMTTRSSVS